MADRAEEYLSQAKMLDEKINNKLAELSQLRDVISEISSPAIGERMQSSPSKDKLGAIVVKIADRKKEVLRDIDSYVDLKAEIIQTIENVKDPMEYNVLHLYYIQGKTISQIAKDIGYSVSGVKRVKNRAVSHIQMKVDPEVS